MKQKTTLKTACIVSTGDELLRGAIADTNAAFLAARLRESGLVVQRVTVVGDDLEAIAEALRESSARADLVVVGGGLGPTTDDLTAQAASLAFDKPLVRFEVAEQMVRRAFARFDRPVPECNLKQADLPEGAEIVPNDFGTAPGFAVSTARGMAVFLPGVPSELESMWPAVVSAYLPHMGSRPRLTLSCFGMGESVIQERLAVLTQEQPGVRFSYRASFPEIHVGFEGDDHELVRTVSDRAAALIGPAVFDREGRCLPLALAAHLGARGLSFATAESCTGGIVAQELTRYPGASSYFRGSIIAYNNEVKSSLLGVSPNDIETFGAVSEPVARAMAEGARRTLGADVSLSTTGIAGPAGGTSDKPVGLVHFAVALPNRTVHRVHTFKGYRRVQVQRAAAFWALHLALEEIRELP